MCIEERGEGMTLGSCDFYRVLEKRYVENCGQDETEIALSFYFDSAKKEYRGGKEGTPFILYVTGTQVERIGTATDEELVGRFIQEGYAVCVADYQNCDSARCPGLDYSAHKLLNRLCAGELFEENTCFYGKKCEQAYLVPAGYYLSRNHIFWSFDKHGADGTLEEIVNIWNNDFRSVKGNQLIYWADVYGNRKSVQTAFDLTEPVWTDKDGKPDKDGKYIYIKHTKAQLVTDCTKVDGSPLNMDLAMNIYYPVNPIRKVPVMCLASSAESLFSCTIKADRPHFHGFLLRGYAGVVYDYGYTPMARADHYGYFDGNAVPGHITGDNVTYSLQFYNDAAINTAAMRYLRYLAATDNRFAFQPDGIGVIGNSKGGWTGYLGQQNPEKHTPHRYFKGHQGESRYENGKDGQNGAFGYIRGGEEQPFLEVEQERLSGRANFIYPGCGGHPTDIFAGNSPMYISCHYDDFSGYANSSAFVSLCKDCDIPAVVSCLNLGHTLCYGKDTRYGFDSYDALYDMAGFFLNSSPVKILYHTCDEQGLHIKFTGAVSGNEINKIKLYLGDGKEVMTDKTSSFGDTLWTMIPDADGRITVRIPAGLLGKNGVAIGTDTVFEYDQSKIKKTSGSEKVRKIFDQELMHCAAHYGDFLRPDEAKAPDGKEAVSIVVTTNISREGVPQFVNDEFYANHNFFRTDNGNKVIVENILGTEGFTEADTGKRYRFCVTVFDTVSRDLQLSLTTGYCVEERVIDFNKAIRNFRTGKDVWETFWLDYTVSEPFEKTAKKLMIAVSSTGVSQMPVYIGKVCAYEVEDGS